MRRILHFSRKNLAYSYRTYEELLLGVRCCAACGAFHTPCADCGEPYEGSCLVCDAPSELVLPLS